MKFSIHFLSGLLLFPAIIISSAIAQSPFKKYKAVLVVGPLQDITADAIKQMNDMADFLKTSGLQVITLYDEDARQESIIRAVVDANIFIYSGHGTNQGDHGRPGGLVLADDYFVTSTEIRSQFKLAKNAVVLFQSVCLGAGSSSLDKSDIGLRLAESRVLDYSSPFIEAGASAYFATNTVGKGLAFLKDFFEGKTIKDIFQKQIDFNTKKETIHAQSAKPDFQIGISSNQSTGTSTLTTYKNGIKHVTTQACFKGYDLAFVSKMNFTIKEAMCQIR